MNYDSRSRRLVAWQAGKTPGPWQVLLFPTFRCNLRCAICSRAWWDDPPAFKHEMSDERLLRLVDESAEAGVQEFCIGGGGEPLVRGEIVMRLCERIKHYKMYGILQTNGTLLTTDRIDQLVRMNWDHINLSIDGPTAETCDAIRQKGVFDKAIAAVRETRAAKTRHKRKLPQMTVVNVITSLNYDRLDQMMEVLHEAGADSVLFKDMIVYAEGMREFALTDTQTAELQGHLERAGRRGLELGLPLYDGSYVQCEQGPGPVGQKSDVTHGYAQALCVEPWLSMVVLCNGSTAPCCSFWEGITTGLETGRLKDVWLGPEYTQFRKNAIEGRGPAPCKTCQPQYVLRKEQVLARLSHYERYRATPWNLAARVLNSLRHHGLRASFARGKEWLLIRKRL